MEELQCGGASWMRGSCSVGEFWCGVVGVWGNCTASVAVKESCSVWKVCMGGYNVGGCGVGGM